MLLQANKSHSFPLTMQLSTLTFQIARRIDLGIHKKRISQLAFVLILHVTDTDPVQRICVFGGERTLSCIFLRFFACI